MPAQHAYPESIGSTTYLGPTPYGACQNIGAKRKTEKGDSMRRTIKIAIAHFFVNERIALASP